MSKDTFIASGLGELGRRYGLGELHQGLSLFIFSTLALGTLLSELVDESVF